MRFVFDLNRDKLSKHKQAAELVHGHKLDDIIDGDTLKLMYTVWIEYWGDVVAKLKAIKSILDDPDVVVSISTKEMRHGMCLIQQVFDQLREVQEIISRRTQTDPQ